MSRTLFFVGLLGLSFLLYSCASRRVNKPARKRYHVKRGCGCTSFYYDKATTINYRG